MQWLILIGFVVGIGGLMALRPWARRFDQRRAARRGPSRHPALRRVMTLAIGVIVLGAAITLYLVGGGTNLAGR
jgi:uncharacterized membrane protein YidH (DUF202 family)